MLLVNAQIQIPLSEFELTYARSSGPGGQNVNKVNSKAVLRWNLALSPSVSPEIKARIALRLASQLSNSGELIITSDRFRDQLRNREDCFEKLRTLLASASFQAKPRKATKPSRSSQRRAQAAKSRHSDKKRLRKVSRHED